MSTNPQVRIQRYFKVPYNSSADLLPGHPAMSQTSGLWYAHFDGQYVVRQMEIHPNKLPILMVTGRKIAFDKSSFNSQKLR